MTDTKYMKIEQDGVQKISIALPDDREVSKIEQRRYEGEEDVPKHVVIDLSLVEWRES